MKATLIELLKKRGGIKITENLAEIADLTGAFHPSELVSYQEHSVVSREMIRKSSGTMTVFAFDAGEGLSEHTAPFDAPVYLLKGKGGDDSPAVAQTACAQGDDPL